MSRLFYLLILCLFLSSCIDKQKQLENKKYILGDWIKVKAISKPITRIQDNAIILISPSLEFITSGYSFNLDNTFENKTGYFKDNGWKFLLGTKSTFKITDDSLSLFNLDNKNWYSFKLLKLSADSLKMGRGEEYFNFVHPHVTRDHMPDFDKIIISTSGCFGTCQISNTIIQSNGAVLFDGKHHTTKIGLYRGLISKEQYTEILNNFKKAAIDSLKTRYEAGHTDDQTITVTFEKNGKIYKTISDYGRSAPTQFVWAYLPLEFLYQTISLKPLKFPEFSQDTTLIMSPVFSKGKMEFGLTQSENFLLYNYLLEGKLSNKAFLPLYKIEVFYHRNSIFKPNSSYNAITDGRYYKFIIKGKPITIDIGLNFYEVNATNMHWRETEKEK
ncbi:DUF6438 domain-containing protein [Mucilaginibacter sp.]|uniref:DUF6438 domain-containing protein n=1 Tax=Mucilaginibacter sp. TaxID=1882438 RepID=UPI002636B6D1|nr:DUF6438 domain-containing protein [Mucilaginibacter sp.]MDB4925395.1 hypothetical protein [Mucilaginibacter sp.]